MEGVPVLPVPFYPGSVLSPKGIGKGRTLALQAAVAAFNRCGLIWHGLIRQRLRRCHLPLKGKACPAGEGLPCGGGLTLWGRACPAGEGLPCGGGLTLRGRAYPAGEGLPCGGGRESYSGKNKERGRPSPCIMSVCFPARPAGPGRPPGGWSR